MSRCGINGLNESDYVANVTISVSNILSFLINLQLSEKFFASPPETAVLSDGFPPISVGLPHSDHITDLLYLSEACVAMG